MVVYVRESHRGNELGKALFEFCVEQAKEQRCTRIQWVVLEWNKPALNFYAKVGAHSPSDGAWRLMRMDQKAIDAFTGTRGNDRERTVSIIPLDK